MTRRITCDVYVDTNNDHTAERDLQIVLLKNSMMARVFDNNDVKLDDSFQEQFERHKKIYGVK